MKKISTMAALVLGFVGSQAQAGELLRSKSLGLLRSDRLIAMSQRLESGFGLFLVQWKKAPTESQKAEIESLGLRVLNYFPDDAFLVQGDGKQASEAANLSFIRMVVPFHHGFKMEPELTQAGLFSFSDQALVSIQLSPGADEAAILAHLRDSRTVGNGLVVGATSVATLWTLAQRPDVLWIERHLPMRSMDLLPSELGVTASTVGTPTRTGYESGTRILNVDEAHNMGFNGQGQIVAVADTGLDTGDVSTLTADFQGQLKTGIAIGVGGKSWGDPMMHGTHVSGSILGNGRSSDGFIRGAAFGAQLVMEGMWSDIMNNIVPPSIPKLFDAGYEQGARIHSNSWGAPGSKGRYDNWAVQTDQWLFDHPDYLAMFAAGNEGTDTSKDGVVDEGSVSSPGTAKNVLTVGASKNLLMEGGIQRQLKDLRNGGDKWGVEPLASSRLSDDVRGMAAFSSRGPTADGRLKPEIVAPGTNIVASRDKHPKADPATMSWGVYDDNYVYMGGTSMSTPVAAGGLAVIRQALLQKLGKQTVSAALLKATAANTSDDLFPGQFGELARGQEQPTRRPNNHEGWGRVNVGNMVTNRSLQVEDERVGLATGQTKEFTVQVTDSKLPLRVTMAYTDAPGVASAQRTLVNDLDLTVTDPSGNTLYPNNRSNKDDVNNMEEIDILVPVSGTYKVTVKAANVPQGKNGAQPYALVISSGQ